MVYMGHRRWLPLRHAFRRKKKIFNGKRELQPAPKDLSGDEVHNMVKDISNEFGKKRKHSKTKEKVAIRGILLPKVRHTIQRLCTFFNAIGQKQTKLCGPAFLREMRPFERYMGVLKSYVRNRAKPEGSIIEGYTTEEAIEFCVNYMSDADPIGVPASRHEGRLSGVGTIGRKRIRPDQASYAQAHYAVLQHMAEVGPYFKEHLAKIRDENLRRSDAWINREHNSRFNEWFKNRVTMSTDVQNETVQLLGMGPSWTVDTWQGYDINGYTFYTVKQDDKSTVQNSGVRIDAFQDQVGSNTYYGRIEDIWELNYVKFKVPLFCFRWVNLRTSVKADKEGFTLVDLSKVGYADEPFVLAKQVEQVFDIKDPSNKKMHIVTDGKRQIVEVDNVIDEEEYNHNLHVMGNAWKNFKTKLVGEFVYNPTNPDPREKFPWITEQVWEEFHAKKLTPESRARSEAYRLLQTRNQHPHWLGTAGYAGKEEEWQREDEEAEESNTPLVFGDIPHPRARNWARARYQKNDDGTIFMPNAEDQRVYEAILVAEQQASQEARSQRREDDVLTKALGNKEHRGWTWGVGSSVPWKYGFPDYAWQYKKWTSNKAEKDARLEAKIRASIRAELTSEFDENLESMRAKIRQEIREEQKNPQAAAAVAHEELGSPTQKRSSCASTELAENPTSVDSAVDHIMELTSCTLTVRMMPTFTIPAAEGLAYKPTPETRVHGVQLRADYAKVQVDSVKPEYELFPLKYPPNDEVLSLGNAHGTFIQWRKDLIEIKVTARPTIAPGGRPPKRPASAPSAPPAQDRHAQSYDVQL
uniref:Transposon protein, putative, CACTA, En/Spm sub-class n=2 Tax=Oryza sativa subsp. japonica TaxID=39947 RepID=Q94GT7_ORYSJ|nr:Putative retrotransposable elements TNP2 [Oryza sativa]AAP52215.1 transposon protein, putative, CACTA, En/Spm sub-class [Oryza sativa Japonica Group]